MPRIDRRAISRRLFLILRMPQNVVKRAVLGCRAEVEFTNGIADAIARIVIVRFRAIRRAGVRRLSHPDPHESHGDGTSAQVNRLDPPFSVSNRSLRKRLPGSAR